jgi:3-oxoacyl-[acyl-carrier-protein] synthase II
MKKSAVITGMGVVTPLGFTIETMWENLLKGKSGIGPISFFDASTFPVRIAAEVKDFDESSIVLPERLEPFVSRASKFCLAAANEAMVNAGIEPDAITSARLGVSLGASEETLTLATMRDAFNEADIYQSLITGDLMRLKRSKALAQIWPIRKSAHIASHILSVTYNAKGPISSSSTACASSAHAIGKAMREIEHGDADIMIAGGSDSCLSEFSVAGFALLGALSQNNEHPEKASRPFDLKRDGFVLGEGAGILILEEMKHARARGATIIAELKGFGTSSNAYRITDSPPDGRGPDQAMKLALDDAALSIEEVYHINAHGTSTLINDRSETLAIKKVFGETAYKIPITANKSMLGHPIAGAGAIELIISAMTMQKGMIPPTINYEYPDPSCDLDYVPNEPRKCEVNTVLSNSFAFGGQNASLVIEKYRGSKS